MYKTGQGWQAITAVVALLTTVLGLVMLAAWHCQATRLLQLIPDTPPLRYNTALAFLWGGLSLWSLLKKQRRWAIGLGSGVFLIGGLTLAQYVGNVDLGIDQLLMQDYITNHLSSPGGGAPDLRNTPVQQLFLTLDHPVPGRASPNTALALCFWGAALLSLSVAQDSTFRRTRWQMDRGAIAGFCAMGMIAIGTLALMGYFTSLSTAYTWRYLTGISLVTAIEAPLVGIVLLCMALQSHSRQVQPPWLPASAAFGIAALSLLLWQALMSWQGYVVKQLPAIAVPPTQALVTPVIHIVLMGGLLLALLVLGVLEFYRRIQIQSERLAATNRHLSFANSLLEATLEATVDGIVVVNLQQNMIHWNARFFQMWNLAAAGGHSLVQGSEERSLLTLQSQFREPDQFATTIAHMMANPGQETFDVLELKDGRIVEQHSQPQWLDQLVVGKVLSYRDITERKQMEEALFQEKELAQVTLSSIGDGVITTNVTGNITYLNPVAEVLTGWTQAEAQGRPLTQVLQMVEEETRAPATNPVAIALQENRVVDLTPDTVLIARDGREAGIDNSAAPIRDRQGHRIGAVMVFRDVTHTRHLTRQVSWQARHDALTGLVNRREFERRLEEALQTAKAAAQSHVLCYLDLDRFKIVNDTCGHVAGDELLRQVTTLFQHQIRKTDVLARLGGDEFTILLHQCDLPQAELVMNVIRDAVAQFRFCWEHHTFSIGVSVGLVTITETSEPLAQLLMAADSACYQAKNKGRNCLHIFRSDHVEPPPQPGERPWATTLTQALENNQFCLFSQPIVAIAHESHGLHCEVLLRFREETGAMMLPETFLPAAERYGLMPQIDRWVIRTLFQHLANLQDQSKGLTHVKPYIYSLNISEASLGDDSFLEFLHQEFTFHSILPHLICFEITESVAISNFSKTSEFIKQFKALGCQFTLEKFGTGIFSLTHLKNLPVDYLKIDDILIKAMLEDPVDLAIIEAISRIAQAMGIKTIVNLVDHQANILARLGDLGVDYAQGNGIALPYPLVGSLS